MTGNIRGLTIQEVERSKERYGSNSLEKEKKKGFLSKFIENLGDPIIKVLLFALAAQVLLTLGRCDWWETGGIVLAILIATTVSTASELGSERAFERMQREGSGALVRAIRDGRVQEVLASDVVVGDVVLLSAGEKICADGTLISGRITVDQSALNGESHDVLKIPGKDAGDWSLERTEKVYRGSIVTDGEGMMRVGRVGALTYYGMVAKDVQTETRQSPLKLRLGRLAAQISRIGYVMAAFVAVTYLFSAWVLDNHFDGARIAAALTDLPSVMAHLIHALTLMITMTILSVPEGLPMMITVVLSANMKRMLRDQILVKKPVGIETAGSMNILLTDKTGTLTTGRLSCDRIVTLRGTIRTSADLLKMGAVGEWLALSARYNTDTVESEGEAVGGNSTDRALAAFFRGVRTPSHRVRSKTPFSSERKFSSVVLEGARGQFALVKGAPDLLLPRVCYGMHPSGERYAIDTDEIEREYRRCGANGERVLAICAASDEGLSRLTFLGIAVLRDRVRRGVRRAVEEITRAGVQIVMVTGDAKETAEAIATECGIYRPFGAHLAIDARELADMSDESVKAILPRIRVVSRALPQDKSRIVRLSQEMDLVVGMTGDGINDAPSLKVADVGFAMGSGADIAKDAADVVILDDSLPAIGKTILYGRTIFRSIRKFITFQLIMNFVACGVSLLGQFIGIENPITIVQMLWINIIMDTLGGLAFAGEPPLDHYMREKPKRRDEPILSAEMLRRIGWNGAYTLLLCIAFLRAERIHALFRPSPSDVCFLTGFYALFIFAGIFNCFSTRTERLWILENIGKNKPFLIIMAWIAFIQILMIYFGGSLFRTVPLLPNELLRVLLLSFSVIPFDVLRRIFTRLCGKR